MTSHSQDMTPAAPKSTPLLVTDHWIEMRADGQQEAPPPRLFARRWQAAAAPDGDDADSGKAPLVLMHDSLGCVALWREFPEALARTTGRSVIAYDRLGFGQSDARQALPPLSFVADEAIEGFAAVRAHFGLQRFAVLGHSVGGGMAVHIAAHYGETACTALVTLSAQAFVEQRTLDGIRVAQAQFADPAQRERLRRYHGDKTDWVLSAWIDNWLSPGFADWRLDAALPKVRCPALVIHGEADEYGSPEHPRRIEQGLGSPDKRALVMAGVGHVPHREQAERTVGEIAGFLAGVG